jgi:hypothetical protein
MAQPSDPFKEAKESSSKSQNPTKENNPQKNKPQKPPKAKESIPETTEQLTPQSEQLNLLDQPSDPFRKARETAANDNEQEYLPSETVPDWRPQQVNEFHPEWMIEHAEPAFEETWDEDPTITSQ